MRERAGRWLVRGLVMLGCGLLAAWLAMTLEGRAFQTSLGRRLEALERSPRGAARAEARASGLIGRLEIPRLGLSTIVVEGTSGRALRRGIGHVEQTAYPGERGNVGLAGHRDTYFRKLKDVAAGDLIRITTPDGEYAYRVDSILVVDPDRGDLLDDADRRELTLVTCYPFYWVGPAPRRFVVRAHQAERLASSGRGSAVGARHPRGASNGGRLATLVGGIENAGAHAKSGVDQP